jgi:hypothetical protein
MTEAKTPLGDALLNFGDLCDLHPEWDMFACLVTRDGLRLCFYGTVNETNPVELARALMFAADVDEHTPPDERDDLHPAPFESA